MNYIGLYSTLSHKMDMSTPTSQPVRDIPKAVLKLHYQQPTHSPFNQSVDTLIPCQNPKKLTSLSFASRHLGPFSEQANIYKTLAQPGTD